MRRIASSIVRGLAEGKQILRQRSLRTPFWRTFFLPEVSRQKPQERSSCTELDVQKATLCISGEIVASSPPFMTLPVQHEHGLHLNVQNLQSENDFLLMTIASWFPADGLEVFLLPCQAGSSATAGKCFLAYGARASAPSSIARPAGCSTEKFWHQRNRVGVLILGRSHILVSIISNPHT